MIEFGLSDDYLAGYNARIKNIPFDGTQSEEWKMGWINADQALKIIMKTKKKNAVFGRYPSCDMLNNALRFIKDGNIDSACAEIIFAIEKAGGYFHEDVVPIVEKVKSYWLNKHRD